MGLLTFSVCLLRRHVIISIVFGITDALIASASDRESQAPLLVQQLGNPNFAVREAAHKELLLLGPAALPALRDGLRSYDLEVKRHCKDIIPSIEQAEWAWKADAYETDRAVQQKYDLPLQKEYEKLIGTDLDARKLFAEVVRTNGEFLQQLVDAADGRRKVYELKCRKLCPPLKDIGEIDTTVAQVKKVCAGDLAALLLAATILKVDQPVKWNNRNHVADLLGNTSVGEATKDKKIGKAFSRLLVAWAQSQRDSITLGYFFYFVYMHDFKEGLIVVRQVIQAKSHIKPSPDFRAVAVAVLAKVGGKAVVDELENLQRNQSVLFHTSDKDPPVIEIGIGNQALAALMLLEGVNPKDFGMVEFPGFVSTPPGTDHNWIVPLYGFLSDSDRRKTQKKWRSGKEKGG
jgi:hypothetical protein